MLCGDENLVVAVRQPYPRKLVVLIKVNGDDADFSDILVSVKLGTLDNALSCDHAKIVFTRSEVGNTDHGADFFVRFKRKKIDRIHALALTTALGNFVAF